MSSATGRSQPWSVLRRLAGGAAAALLAGPRAIAHLGSATHAASGRPRAVVSFLLWLPALVLGVFGGIAIVRGLCYGLLVGDDGWVNAWGGPSLLGAWIVHAVVGILIACVAVLGLNGIATMLDRVDRRLVRNAGSRLPIVAAVPLALLSAVFLVLWLRQI